MYPSQETSSVKCQPLLNQEASVCPQLWSTHLCLLWTSCGSLAEGSRTPDRQQSPPTAEQCVCQSRGHRNYEDYTLTRRHGTNVWGHTGSPAHCEGQCHWNSSILISFLCTKTRVLLSSDVTSIFFKSIRLVRVQAYFNTSEGFPEGFSLRNHDLGGIMFFSVSPFQCCLWCWVYWFNLTSTDCLSQCSCDMNRDGSSKDLNQEAATTQYQPSICQQKDKSSV